MPFSSKNHPRLIWVLFFSAIMIVFSLLVVYWHSILLYFFSLSTLCIFLFASLLYYYQPKTTNPLFKIQIQPFGALKFTIFFSFALLFIQSVLIIALDLESIYHPQVLDDYGYLYFIALILLQSAVLVVSLWKMWASAKIFFHVDNKQFILFRPMIKTRQKWILLTIGLELIVLAFVIADILLINHSSDQIIGWFPVLLPLPEVVSPGLTTMFNLPTSLLSDDVSGIVISNLVWVLLLFNPFAFIMNLWQNYRGLQVIPFHSLKVIETHFNDLSPQEKRQNQLILNRFKEE